MIWTLRIRSRRLSSGERVGRAKLPVEALVRTERSALSAMKAAKAMCRRLVITVIQCSTLCTQRKVTKFPCFGALSLGLRFNIFWNFFAHFFAMQLALASMITVTLISSLSVFCLQRTRRFRTTGE